MEFNLDSLRDMGPMEPAFEGIYEQGTLPRLTPGQKDIRKLWLGRENIEARRLKNQSRNEAARDEACE